MIMLGAVRELRRIQTAFGDYNPTLYTHVVSPRIVHGLDSEEVRK